VAFPPPPFPLVLFLSYMSYLLYLPFFQVQFFFLCVVFSCSSSILALSFFFWNCFGNTGLSYSSEVCCPWLPKRTHCAFPQQFFFTSPVYFPFSDVLPFLVFLFFPSFARRLFTQKILLGDACNVCTLPPQFFRRFLLTTETCPLVARPFPPPKDFLPDCSIFKATLVL